MNFGGEDDKWKVNEEETVVFGSKHFQVSEKGDANLVSYF